MLNVDDRLGIHASCYHHAIMHHLHVTGYHVTGYHVTGYIGNLQRTLSVPFDALNRPSGLKRQGRKHHNYSPTTGRIECDTPSRQDIASLQAARRYDPIHDLIGCRMITTQTQRSPTKALFPRLTGDGGLAPLDGPPNRNHLPQPILSFGAHYGISWHPGRQ